MKKLIFTLSLTLIPFYTFAYEGTISQSGSCGATDADCHYDLYEDGHLEISGTGEMSNWNYREGRAAPWAPANAQEFIDGNNAVTSVNINGITKVGRWAFLWCNNLTDVQIGNSVKTIEGAAFESTGNLGTFVIPDTVEKIVATAFQRSKAEKIVIEGTPELEGAFIRTPTISIYCNQNLDCADHGYDDGTIPSNKSGTIIPYEKQGGVFILDGKYYLSGSDMAVDTNVCDKELNECKRDVLEAKGICQGSACDTFIQSDGQYMLKYNGKTYQDINALLKGNYDRRRIYTIEEANFVAGDKNRVSIKYR